jgi:hypothetical protein
MYFPTYVVLHLFGSRCSSTYRQYSSLTAILGSSHAKAASSPAKLLNPIFHPESGVRVAAEIAADTFEARTSCQHEVRLRSRASGDIRIIRYDAPALV